MSASDDLVKKLTKQYEGKIAALSAINSALQKENDKLREQLSRRPVTDAEEELEELQAEFQARLGAQDRTIASLQEEKSRLATALAAAKAAAEESDAKVAELQAAIGTLNAEGGTLSRKAGDLESTNRKLRSANKDLEVERDKLQARVKILEVQLIELQDKADIAAKAAAQQISSLQEDMTAVRQESSRAVAEAKRQAQDAVDQLQAEAARGGAELLAAAKERETALAGQLSELRDALSITTSEASAKEDAFRKQIKQLEEKVRQMEMESSNVSVHSYGDTTQPLLKQIEAMAQQAAAAESAAQRTENALMERIDALESAVARAEAGERSAVARAVAAEAAAASGKESASAAIAAAADVQSRLAAEQRASRALDAEREAAEERLNAALGREEQLKADLERVKLELGDKIWDLEQRVRTLSQERDELLQRLDGYTTQGTNASVATSTGQSERPQARTQSVAIPATPTDPHQLASPSMNTNAAAMHDVNQGASTATTPQVNAGVGVDLTDADASELDVLLRNFTEAAAATAKQKRVTGAGIWDGLLRLQPGGNKGPDPGALVRTVELLQKRVHAAEKARASAEQQLVAFMNSQSANSQEATVKELRAQLAEMERRCDIALELIGERNEAIEQMEEDIKDMRTIFHNQLEVAVSQLQATQEQLELLKALPGNASVSVDRAISVDAAGGVSMQVADGSHRAQGHLNGVKPVARPVFVKDKKAKD